MADLARCPACRSTSVSIVETHEEVGVTDPGPVRVVDGKLYHEGPFRFEVGGGDPRVSLECGDCGHGWYPRPRRVVGGPVDELRTR